MSDKKEKFLTRNYILMLLLNCIYGVYFKNTIKI